MLARPNDDPNPARGSNGRDERAADGGSEPAATHVRTVSDGGEDLPGILKMLTKSPDARGELVEDIRAQIRSGEYLNEERLNVAIYRLLKDLLA